MWASVELHVNVSYFLTAPTFITVSSKQTLTGLESFHHCPDSLDFAPFTQMHLISLTLHCNPHLISHQLSRLRNHLKMAVMMLKR